MNIFFLTLFFITVSPYADANSIFNEEKSFITAKAVKLGRGNGLSGWEKAQIVIGKRAVNTEKECTAHCAACNTKTGQCSKCEDGYWIEGGSCNLCSDFLENCALCDSTGSTCTKCFDGYKLTGGSCSSGSCEDGYWWNDTDLACFSCPSDCKTCSDDATCESCFNGYYHDMGSCVACPQNCEQCNYNGCIKCRTDYELKNGKCEKVTCSIPYCLSCSGNTCLQCKDGYEKNKNGECKKVEKPEHCTGNFTKQNDGSYKCSKCETGYTGNKCDTCANGYIDTRTYDDAYFQCLECPSACAACVIREFEYNYDAQCSLCPSGKELVCEQNVQTCKTPGSYEVNLYTYKGVCLD